MTMQKSNIKMQNKIPPRPPLGSDPFPDTAVAAAISRASTRGGLTPRGRGGFFLLLASCLLLPSSLFLFSACPGKKAVQAPKEVTVTSPERGLISQTVAVTGSIEAEDFAEIYPRAPGKVIKKLLNEGDPVKKEQAIMLTLQDEVGYTFKPAPVVSKISGYVGRIMVDVGATVSPQVPVATVVRPDTMRIKIDLPERYLPAIKLGAKVTFSTDTLPGEAFEAEIASISQAIDIKNRTARVELRVPNENGKLIHGMFARLDMPIETHENALTIPVSAVSWEADKQFVYKVKDNIIQRAQINIGIRNKERVEILEGVSEGDILSNGRLIDLADGERVIVKEEDKDIREEKEF